MTGGGGTNTKKWAGGHFYSNCPKGRLRNWMNRSRVTAVALAKREPISKGNGTLFFLPASCSCFFSFFVPRFIASVLFFSFSFFAFSSHSSPFRLLFVLLGYCFSRVRCVCSLLTFYQSIWPLHAFHWFPGTCWAAAIQLWPSDLQLTVNLFNLRRING